MTTGNIVECGKFYTVNTDKHVEFGINKDQTVLVVGEGMFPNSEQDPYQFRKFFAIAPFEGGVLDFDKKPLVVSPESLQEVDADTQGSLQNLLEAFQGGLNEVPN